MQPNAPDFSPNRCIRIVYQLHRATLGRIRAPLSRRGQAKIRAPG
jgi:hypothetical protein